MASYYWPRGISPTVLIRRFGGPWNDGHYTMTNPNSTANNDESFDADLYDVVVVGGGITGLSAAWFVRQNQPTARIVVLEASTQPGGKIASAHIAGVRVDCGPDAFLARVEGAVELATELGLGNELVAPATGQAWLWSRGRLRALPQGLVLGVPTQLSSLAKSRILSPQALARVALSEVIPNRTHLGIDPTVRAAIGSHLGNEVVDRLVDPLLGGINASDCDRLSLASAAPTLVDAAGQGHMMRTLRRTQAAASRGAIGSEPTKPQTALFLTPRLGVATLVTRLSELLGDVVAVGQMATGIRRHEQNTWVVSTGPREFRARTVILATPAAVTSGLLENVSTQTASLLKGIRTSSVALTLLAYPRSAVDLPPGSGMLVPRVDGKLMTASSWWNQKWLHLDTKGHVLIRASAGRDGDTRFTDLTDDELVNRLHQELSDALPITGRPVDSHVARWMGGFPQYESGHLARVEAAEQALAADAPGLHLVGASYRGIGIPACIRSAKSAATAVAAAINGSSQ